MVVVVDEGGCGKEGLVVEAVAEADAAGGVGDAARVFHGGGGDDGFGAVEADGSRMPDAVLAGEVEMDEFRFGAGGEDGGGEAVGGGVGAG